MKKYLIQKNNSKGFTLLFALLVSVLVLSVGASIISVALRQNVLSNTGRESQYAFYAANTGIECALYWDLNYPSDNADFRIFPYTSTEYSQTLDLDNINLGIVRCGDGDITNGAGFTGHDNYIKGWTRDGNTTDFEISIRDSTDSNDIPDHPILCASVKVVKFLDTSKTPNKIGTRITSQGLNTCNPENPRAVQRGLVLEY